MGSSYSLINIFYSLLKASGLTLSYSFAIITMGTLMGLILATLYSTGRKEIRAPISLFIFLVRGIPMIVNLFIFFYVLPLFGVRIPAIYIALFGLSIANSAYICEIFRGGIESVPAGQVAAFRSLGMSYWSGMKEIILPQAMRNALPPLINWWVIMVKVTSLVSVLSLRDLTYAGREMSTYTGRPFTVLLLVALIYFCICFPLSRFGEYLERRFSYIH